MYHSTQSTKVSASERTRIWRLQNPEKYRKQVVEYYAKNKERIKAYQKSVHHRYVDKQTDYRRKHYDIYPWRKFLHSLRTRCNSKSKNAWKYYGSRGIKSEITESEIKYIWFRDRAFKMKKPSIHRIDSRLNYNKDNCVFVELSDNCRIVLCQKCKESFFRGAVAPIVVGK